MSGTSHIHARRLAIRRGMDVYGSYQFRYIGSVVDLITSPLSSVGAHDHVAGRRQHVLEREHVSGEELGPFPTLDLGNRGPISQSITHDYATHDHGVRANVRGIVVRPGLSNPFARPLYIPVRAIHSVSMERLIVDVPGADVPPEWRSRDALDASHKEV